MSINLTTVLAAISRSQRCVCKYCVISVGNDFFRARAIGAIGSGGPHVAREYDRNLLPVSAARCQTLRTSKFTRAVQLIAVI